MTKSESGESMVERACKSGVFFENSDADNLKNFVKTGLDVETLFDDGDKHVDGNRDPDLSLQSVGSGSVKRFDAEMLFDPLKEQLDLPSASVKLGHGERWQSEIVGQEDEAFVAISIQKMNTAEFFGVTSARIISARSNDLIAEHSGGFVDFQGVETIEGEVASSTGHKERRSKADLVESSEIEIAAIHDVKGSGLEDQVIEKIEIRNLAVCNQNKRRNVATQVQHGVQLDGSFLLLIARPWKQGKTQIDHGGIQRVDTLIDVETEAVASIELAGRRDQRLSEIGVDAPVAHRIGMG